MSHLSVDRTGEVYGRLTVLRRASNDKNGGTRWECRCECGAFPTVRYGDINNGRVFSCGCLNRELASERCRALGKSRERHGMAKTPEYQAWRGARNRVNDPNNASWDHYGGRGIDMDPEWNNPSGFESFIAHIGPKPDVSLSLDRIDGDRGYWPGNVRWADASTQNLNRRGYGANK